MLCSFKNGIENDNEEDRWCKIEMQFKVYSQVFFKCYEENENNFLSLIKKQHKSYKAPENSGLIEWSIISVSGICVKLAALLTEWPDP